MACSNNNYDPLVDEIDSGNRIKIIIASVSKGSSNGHFHELLGSYESNHD